MLILAVLCSGTFLMLNTPGVYDWLFLEVFGTTAQIAAAARPAMLWMVFWPALIAWRRFYQGVMIRNKQGGWLDEISRSDG